MAHSSVVENFMNKPRIAITMGDPAGVGPEITLKAVRHPEVLEMCTPVIIGDGNVLSIAARILFQGSESPHRRTDHLHQRED